MGHGVKRAVVVCATALGLSGCLSDANGAGFVTKADGGASTQVVARKKTHQEKINSESRIIQGLASRRSVLPAGGAFDEVATAVLAANSRAAEADLRGARLRSEAASKNWLPKIGPNISLSSLGSLVANLVVDQVLFDNGKRKGEREFAIADVEVAAVGLAQDTNTRVHTALSLYTQAVEGRQKSALFDAALADMGHFEWVMSERVKGGVSNSADLNILHQKLGEIRSDRARNSESATTALAELNAMSVRDLEGLRGLSAVPVKSTAAQPLSVTLAEAEKLRAIAAAKVERAGNLPGLTASATIGEGGSAGLNLGSDQLFGLGTGATLQAIEAAKEAAGRRVAQAQEDANRVLRKQESQIAAKERQSSEAAKLTAQAKINLDLFRDQYEAGQRQVIDVVGVYETYARQQQNEVTLKFEAIRLRLEMAQVLGVLADGNAI